MRRVGYADVWLIVASPTADGILELKRLYIVPFGNGRCVIKRSSASQTVRLVEHYFSGQTFEQQITSQSNRIELDLQQTRERKILTGLEIIFA